jgi:ABC-type phosphate transport system permease subunit
MQAMNHLKRYGFTFAPLLIAVLFMALLVGFFANLPTDADNDSISDNVISAVAGHPLNAGFKLLLLIAMLMSVAAGIYLTRWWHVLAESWYGSLRVTRILNTIRGPPSVLFGNFYPRSPYSTHITNSFI